MIAAFYAFAIGIVAGSVPFAWLLHRVATGRDLRSEGSGNPGATNLARSDGWLLGGTALVLDAGKGAAAVAIATQCAGPGAAVFAALGAVFGHVFSPFLSGRGGKGVATAAGAFAMIAPAPTLGALAVYGVVVAVTRIVSLASVAAAAALPVLVSLSALGGSIALAAAAIAVLIAWRHRENFERMRAGTEPRVGEKPPQREGGSE